MDIIRSHRRHQMPDSNQTISGHFGDGNAGELERNGRRLDVWTRTIWQEIKHSSHTMQSDVYNLM